MDKLLVIGVLAAIIIGPDRLPRYAEAFARFLGRSREWLRGAKTRVRDEMGEDFDDVDWRKLDPRQYDPRRIIREALIDDAPVATAAQAPAAGAARTTMIGEPTRKADVFDSTNPAPPPFDAEAT